MKKFFVVLAAALVLLAAFIAVRPGDFYIERSATINAPPEKLFALVNDLHTWNEWSPWARLDPNPVTTFEGPAQGLGATMHWSGNKEVGKGTLTITESTPPETIVMALDFVEPMQASNTVEFTFEDDDAGTIITWSMSGTNNFIGKAFTLFVDCDAMVGSQFETGLANLKQIAEK